MLDEFIARVNRSGLSLRIVANELGVSHTLLSLVLSGRRNLSVHLRDSIAKWMATPISVAADPNPAFAIRRFLAERRPALAQGTVRFYEQRLIPFVLWCEEHQHEDVTLDQPTDQAAILTELRH